MKKIYLVLAILGAVVPYLFFFQFIQLNGIDIPKFIVSLFANGAAGARSYKDSHTNLFRNNICILNDSGYYSAKKPKTRIRNFSDRSFLK